ncbi:STAS domain-containing protein [Cognatishimia sp. WU-CL00825]|uniref:STAS domain-containing protein n=1 Tax=Cognatishimia sp. WU-CL00825 TaxID=3127658 RepID=UPI00310418DD
MKLSSNFQGPDLVITILANRIDASVALQFKEAMRVETEVASDRIILDMTQVEFVDSSGLGAIVGAMKQNGEARPFELVGLSKAVKKVFQLTRMDTVFTIYGTLDIALSA